MKTRYLLALPVAACLLLGAASVQAKQDSPAVGGLDWSINTSWTMPCHPLDFVQSLDNKKVFVLCDDSKVRIYTPAGKELGVIPVEKDITGIDIAPRGEALYLISKSNKSYTALDVSLTQHIDISGSPFVGNENAPVTLVVFSDFQ